MANPLEGEFPRTYPILERWFRLTEAYATDPIPVPERSWCPQLSMLVAAMPDSDPYKEELRRRAAGFSEIQLPCGFGSEAYKSFMTAALKVSDLVQIYVFNMSLFEMGTEAFEISFLNSTPDVQKYELDGMFYVYPYGQNPIYLKFFESKNPRVKESLARHNLGFLLTS